MQTPINTLFLLQSLDGKISPGKGDVFDIGRDFSKIKGLKEGLMQYYKLEQEADLCPLNSGKVMAKIGMNDKDYNFEIYSEMSFVIVDNSHLTEIGVSKMASKLKKLFIVSKNPSHPAFALKNKFDNLEILYYKDKIDFVDMMQKLKNDYKIENITIQSGGTLNSILFENNLIHKIFVVIAPVIIGGKDTSSLVDGKSLETLEDLQKLHILKLQKIIKLENNYLHLEYDVLEKTEVEEGFSMPN